jgi:hypothetical protein
MKKYIYPALFFSLTPILCLGASDVLGLIATIQDIFSAIVPLIISLAVIFFLWSTAQYILREGDSQKDAKDHMMWGIIILFVMVSVWGLVAILGNTFLS